jgi:hypothetical protein
MAKLIYQKDMGFPPFKIRFTSIHQNIPKLDDEVLDALHNIDSDVADMEVIDVIQSCVTYFEINDYHGPASNAESCWKISTKIIANVLNVEVRFDMNIVIQS